MYARSIAQLIEELGKLPGIGPKSAQRLAFHLLFQSKEDVKTLIEAIVKAKEEVKYCSQCQNLTDVNPCPICSDLNREKWLLCVVENPQDVAAMERIREYRGQYHVLHGVISPMDGVGPEDLKIRELLQRLSNQDIKEIIIATNPTVEGEATAMYLAKLIKPLGIKLTRIARGLPEGGDIDYVDQLTLVRALEGRREIDN